MRTPSILFALSFPALAGSPKESAVVMPEPEGWDWSVSVGPSFRQVGSVTINSGYRSGAIHVPSFVGGPSLVQPAIGGEDSYFDRTYNDGYVDRDPGTSADGATWAWGYQNADQVQGDRLAYHATGSQSVLRESFHSPGSGPSSRDSLRAVSPHIQVDARGPRKFLGFQLGFSGGFDFSQVDQSLEFSSFSAAQSRDDYRLDYLDAYDLNGVIPPAAPYFGGSSGPGPVIGNIPSFRSVSPVLLSTESAFFANRVSTAIDIDVFSFTIGPSLTRSWGAWSLSLQGGAILNIYDWETQQTEQLDGFGPTGSASVARWSDGESGIKFRPGVYGQASAFYDFAENLSAGGYLRLDTASEFRAAAGPSTFKIDPSGYSAGILVRFLLP